MYERKPKCNKCKKPFNILLLTDIGLSYAPK